MSDQYKIDEVFGIMRDKPLNYVAREYVDERLIDSLSRRQHIVIHGGSKQGKTCLRKHCLQESDYSLIQCAPNWSLAQLNAQILKRAGYEVEQGTTRTVAGGQKMIAKFSGILFGVGAGAEGERERSQAVETGSKPLEIDIEDTNDIIAALRKTGFDLYIVLEDFHYLPPETQRQFSFALKAFHESSELTFIIVGVWLEENRLIVYNGDLTGRVVSVNADKWTADELEAVISDGAALLNVRFDHDFRVGLIAASFESVAVVQEVCRVACRQSGVFETQDSTKVVGPGLSVDALVQQYVENQAPRYHAFIQRFADGFQKTDLEMYRWLLYPILKATPRQLEKGIRYADLRESIQSKHPRGRGLNLGNLTQALQNAAALQVSKGITPLVMDYDQTNNRLTVVDRGFLIWMAIQFEQELLEMAGLPVD